MPRGSHRSTNVLDNKILGIPMTTFIATCISGGCYLLALILVLACSCEFTTNVIMFFIFLIFALIAVGVMASINMVYPRYRFNCLSLSVSLIYSGSAALIVFGIIMTASNGGLCMGKQGIFVETPTVMPPGTTVWTTTTSTVKPSTPMTTAAPSLPGPAGTGDMYHKVTASIFIWLLSAIGLAFQIVGHYYYG